MRKGYTVTELLFVIIFIVALVFVAWVSFKGSPNLRLMTGIGVVALYLPACLANIARGCMDGIQAMCMAVGVMLIASKFVFPGVTP